MTQTKDNQGMSNQMRYLLAAVLICSALLLGIAAPVTAADLSTDKADYAPWETVCISGGGFSPGATVTMTVEWPAPDNGVYEVLPAPVADQTGRIAADYPLIRESGGLGIEGTFIVVAVDSETGLSASTTFTDMTVPIYVPSNEHWVIFELPSLPANTYVHVTYQGTTPSGSLIPETIVNFRAPKIVKTKPGSIFTYWNFDTTAVNGQYVLISPQAGTITTGAGGLYSYVIPEYEIPDDNSAPTAAFTFYPETPTVGETVNFYDDSADTDGPIVSWSWDFGDGETSTSENPTHAYTKASTYPVTLTVTDDKEAQGTVTADVLIANAVPVITSITVPMGPGAVDFDIETTATFTDLGVGETHTATWDWGDESTSTGYVNEGTGSVSGSHSYDTPGIYTVSVNISDGTDSVTASSTTTTVVYDPSAGFATGGGWFVSPAGACADDKELTGKANFGFVSKYKKDSTVPECSVEFQFKPADLNFKSSECKYLVIAESEATFEGVGTVNGTGNYGFILSAMDGSPDTFGIKIWDKEDDDKVVYDNLGTFIDGGNVVVHN